MKEEVFRELVDLYLDREITEDQLSTLRKELASNEDRMRAFEEARRFQQAMQMALQPKDDGWNRAVFNSSRILVGVGLAASFVLGGLVLSPLLYEETALNVEFSNAEEIERIRERQLRRALAAESSESHLRGGIAANLRLMGLQPDVMPDEVILQVVEIEESARSIETYDAVTYAEVLKEDLEPVVEPLPVTDFIQAPAYSHAERAKAWRQANGFEARLAGY